MSPKKRRPTFSQSEESAIKEGYLDYKEIIEAPFSNGVTKKDKDCAWSKITERVNSTGNCQRTVVEIMKKFKNMKQKVKERVAKENKSACMTGGGPPIYEVSKAFDGSFLELHDLNAN